MTATPAALDQTALVPLDDLRGDERNPKAHDLALIADSLRRFGWAEPVVVDQRTGLLVSGHGRTAALRGMRDAGEDPPAGVTDDWRVPTFTGWASTDDDEAAAALVALNRTTERGGWDHAALADLLERLDTVGGAGLSGTGYQADDLDELRAKLRALEPATVEQDEDLEPPADPEAQLGDLWTVGPHRIVCGDARDPDTWVRLLDGVRPQVVFTSPPYASQRNYASTPGFEPIPPDGYVDWWEPLQATAAEHLDPAGSLFVNIRAHAEDGQRHLYVHDLVAAHVRRWGWRFVDDLCWVRPSLPGNWPDRFRNGWEPIYHFARGRPRMHPLGPGVASTGVWKYDPTTDITMGADGYVETGAPQRGDGVARPSNVIRTASGHAAGNTGEHEAEFPPGLPTFFVLGYSDRGATIVDPFLGSGTTALAAHQQGRIGAGIELSPRYVDLAVRRLAAATGDTPEVHR